MYQGEQVVRHWEATGEFHLPDGVAAVIQSRPMASPDDGRRATYVYFPDGSEVSLQISQVLGLVSIGVYWCYDPHENWPVAVVPVDAK